MIYLWTDEKGWEEFEVTDTAELEKREITIGDGAYIGDGSRIGDGAYIGARSRLGDGADLGAWSRIGDGAYIGDGAKPVIIYIIGSRVPVSYWGEDRVDIGCQHRSIGEWLTGYEEIADKHEFTPEQIAEYRGYVEFIASIHNRGDQKPEE
jgi:carbonic anhydrase/acetyltransferase-like protein (isoleucine patch superfamily)